MPNGWPTALAVGDANPRRATTLSTAALAVGHPPETVKPEKGRGRSMGSGSATLVSFKTKNFKNKKHGRSLPSSSRPLSRRTATHTSAHRRTRCNPRHWLRIQHRSAHNTTFTCLMFNWRAGRKIEEMIRVYKNYGLRIKLYSPLQRPIKKPNFHVRSVYTRSPPKVKTKSDIFARFSTPDTTCPQP